MKDEMGKVFSTRAFAASAEGGFGVRHAEACDGRGGALVCGMPVFVARTGAWAVGPVGQVGRLFPLSHRLYAIKPRPACHAAVFGEGGIDGDVAGRHGEAIPSDIHLRGSAFSHII